MAGHIANLAFVKLDVCQFSRAAWRSYGSKYGSNRVSGYLHPLHGFGCIVTYFGSQNANLAHYNIR